MRVLARDDDLTISPPCRYLQEGIAVLAEQAPDLHTLRLLTPGRLRVRRSHRSCLIEAMERGPVGDRLARTARCTGRAALIGRGGQGRLRLWAERIRAHQEPRAGHTLPQRVFTEHGSAHTSDLLWITPGSAFERPIRQLQPGGHLHSRRGDGAEAGGARDVPVVRPVTTAESPE